MKNQKINIDKILINKYLYIDPPTIEQYYKVRNNLYECLPHTDEEILNNPTLERIY